MITTSCDAASERPLVIIVHASVGSGHRSAANAVAQVFEDLAGSRPDLPADTEIAVLDILDYGRVRFDGDKTANVTVVFNGLYDFTWHHAFTGRILWGGGWGGRRSCSLGLPTWCASGVLIAIVATNRCR